MDVNRRVIFDMNKESPHEKEQGLMNDSQHDMLNMLVRCHFE